MKFRLEEEIVELKAVIAKQHMDKIKSEQEIRTRLVEDFEERTRQSNLMWEKRVQFHENNFKRQVRFIDGLLFGWSYWYNIY